MHSRKMFSEQKATPRFTNLQVSEVRIRCGIISTVADSSLLAILTHRLRQPLLCLRRIGQRRIPRTRSAWHYEDGLRKTEYRFYLARVNLHNADSRGNELSP